MGIIMHRQYSNKSESRMNLTPRTAIAIQWLSPTAGTVLIGLPALTY